MEAGLHRQHQRTRGVWWGTQVGAGGREQESIVQVGPGCLLGCQGQAGGVWHDVVKEGCSLQSQGRPVSPQAGGGASWAVQCGHCESRPWSVPCKARCTGQAGVSEWKRTPLWRACWSRIAGGAGPGLGRACAQGSCSPSAARVHGYLAR